ncbi:MAG: prolipoprotein diacylglyceryl transferase [Fidelibacterota bacterium]
MGNATVTSWIVFGLGNILIGKLLILYLGVRRGWNFFHWTVILLFSTLGGSLAAWLIPSIMSVVLGAIGFLLLAKWLLGFQHEVSDLIAVFLAVAIGLGRIGCLFNGCCFGAPTALPWGITYPTGTPAHWLHVFTGKIAPFQSASLAVHPVQLYESIFMAIALILILVFQHKVHRKTVLLFGFLGAYFWIRFGIEFIRDMTNVWWSEIYLGPFSVFQWFLLLTGLFFLSGAIKHQRQRLPSRSSSPYLTPDWLVALTGAGILWGHADFQPVQLTQLLALFPLAVVAMLWQKRRQPVYRVLATGLAGVLVVFLLTTSLASRLQARDKWASTSDNRPGTTQQWLYIINPADQKLVRFGNQRLSFADYLRRREALNWRPNDGLTDSARYRDMKHALSRRTVTYFGALGAGKHEFQATGCGGEIITYQRQYQGLALGRETKISGEKKTKYYGFYGSLFTENWTKNRHSDFPLEKYRNNYGLFNTYYNVDWKYVGLGAGGFILTRTEDNDFGNLLLPNFYLRMGPPRFSLEVGFNDRALIRPDPLTLHMNALVHFPSGHLRFGVMSMGKPFDAFFIEGSRESEPGLTWHPTVIITNGVGFNLQLDYRPPESGKQ